ncbi:MAG: hypothetical protein E2O84_03560 [Bacteroidetes bacterium]|nr:MAG: hypothetical protein E2O84_03560 [Bacteroidota bacterium]
MSKIQSALEKVRDLRLGADGGPNLGRREADEVDTRDPMADTWVGIPQVNLDVMELARHRIIVGDSVHEVAEMSYKMLRTRMIRRMRDNNWSSIVVTSADAGAGKSVTAINLAISAAREPNQTVYLIDLDLRRSSLHKYLGVQPPAGDLTA